MIRDPKFENKVEIVLVRLPSCQILDFSKLRFTRKKKKERIK